MNNLSITRNNGIDLARSVAIFAVILVHTTGIGFGRFGVQLFFVISGFLLARYYEVESSSSFLFRRIARLLPLFLIASTYYSLRNNELPNVLNVLLLGNLTWTTNQIPGGWSISSEWIFSLILIATWARTRIQVLTIIFLSISAQILTGLYVYTRGGADSPANAEIYKFLTWINTTNPIVNLSFFLIGVALRSGYIPVIKSRIVLLCLLIVSIMIDSFIGHFMAVWNVGLYAAFLICFNSELSSRLASSIRFIGKRTYGIFFAHFVLMEPISRFLGENFTLAGLSYYFTYFLAVFLSSLLCGSVTWLLIESPFIRFSRTVSKKLRGN
jgi:peptidoglycan/LPS O-acetylase OafA/YrhL